eukprot:5696515-Pyramimonas_sp.AAC.1
MRGRVGGNNDEGMKVRRKRSMSRRWGREYGNEGSAKGNRVRRLMRAHVRKGRRGAMSARVTMRGGE